MLEIKEKLLQACYEFVEEKSRINLNRTQSLQSDLQIETKSSAGDKHETGRAMLQLEIEKSGKQLASILQSKEMLAKVYLSTSKVVRLGSLIETNKGNYFLAISVGIVLIDEHKYFVVSTVSPIGKALLGKKEGEELLFNGRKIKINSIS